MSKSFVITAKVIYSAYGRKAFVFKQIKVKLCKQLIHDYDNINVNTCQHGSADHLAGDNLGEYQ